MKKTIVEYKRNGASRQTRSGVLTMEFPEYGYKAKKSGKCKRCKKVRQRTVVFYQCKSGFNNKPIQQILDEEKTKAGKWLGECFKCSCGDVIE